MAALDFPASPSTGQIFSSGSITWQYDGSKWVILAGPSLAAEVTKQSDRMACLVNHNVAQSTATGVLTTLAFNSETFDTHNLHSAINDNSRITVPVGGAGLWQIGYTLSWDVSSAGNYRGALIKINGGASPYLGYTNVAAVGYTSQSGSHLYRFTDGQYITLHAVQDSGATLNVRGTNTVGQLISFWATRLGD